MKVFQTCNTAKANVTCIHPKKGKQSYTFVVVQDRAEYDKMEVDEINAKIRKQIEKQVNSNGFWKSVEIALVYEYDREIYVRNI